MSAAPGVKLGPYELLARIGAGGMGEVWKARDTRLGRLIAIKVAGERFSDRFESEARAIATLNHPNICQLYDVGPDYLVMEYLEGEPLKGPLPLSKALLYGAQICDALHFAHRKGIIHRDLKPANLLVTKAGMKLLDFGLAKFTRSSLAPSEDSVTLPITTANTVLGTIQYMSPEQLEGESVDARSDIFSFGCVLYEIISGRPSFEGPSRARVMTAILRDEPPGLDAVSSAPPAVNRAVKKCLAKDPDQRWQTAADLADELRWLAAGRDREQSAQAQRRRRPWWPAAAVALAGILAGGAAVRMFWRPTVEPVAAPRYLTYSGRDSSPVFSPDGRTVAFASDRDGQSRIWLKQVADGSEAVLTSGPDDNPRFFADGSTLLFSRHEGAHTSLYRASIVGGQARKVVDDAVAGDLSPDGRRIAFVRWKSGGGQEISVVGTAGADGSNVAEVAHVQGFLLDLPRWSPDASSVAAPGSAQGGFRDRIFVFSADGKKQRLLTAPLATVGISSVAWVSNDELVYLDGDRFQAVPPLLVRQSVSTGESRSHAWPHVSLVLDVAKSGDLVFDTQSDRSSLRELAFRAPGGALKETRWIARGKSVDRQPAYSPDGSRVVFTSNRAGSTDIWQISTDSGALTRLTYHPGSDIDPAFAPDGKRLIWTSDRSGHFEIYIGPADGSSATQVTRDGRDAENATMTADGNWIVYASTHPDKVGVWKVHPDGSGATRLTTAGYNAEVSPDGRLALYLTTLRNNQNAIRVLRIDDGAVLPFEIRCDIRKQNGWVIGRARWMPDGKRIAFVGQDDYGVNGIFVQDFAERQDTTASRRPLGGFDPEIATETFGISPDGQSVTISSWEQVFSVMIADRVSLVRP